MRPDAHAFGQLFVKQLADTSIIEWTGTITGALCVYLAAKQRILNWPVSIISVCCYALLFFEYRLYGEALLQFYFLFTAIYGWYYWKKRNEQRRKEIISLNTRQNIITLLSIGGLSVVMGYILARYTNSDVPYMDGFCTAASFIAQYLMTRKVLQSWILWILVDAIYVPLYLYKHLALTSLLYVVFLILALAGYKEWKSSWKTRKGY